MKRFFIFIIILSIIEVAYGATWDTLTWESLPTAIVSRITGIWGKLLPSWVFYEFWNEWQMNFSDVPRGYTGATFIGQDLQWWFWTQSYGWTNLWEFAPVMILPPSGSGNIIFWWTLSWYVWNEYIGWILFPNPKDFPSGGWVMYDPVARAFSWYALNLNGWLTWINFNSWPSYFGSGFIGKVKIIGNIAGDNIFTTLYSPWVSISNISTDVWVNQIRKNVALLTRNASVRINTLSFTEIALPNAITEIFRNMMILRPIPALEWWIIAKWWVSYFDPEYGVWKSTEPVRSIIMIGGDIYIEGDIAPWSESRPRSIIALKDDAWKGGNIYIGQNVKNIYSSLIAEGSIFSGDSGWATGIPRKYNDTREKILTLPQNQLVIHGSVISHNTIGGSIVNATYDPTCPFGALSCDRISSLQYDLNYFRASLLTQDDEAYRLAHRAWKDNSYDEYSVIIEYDPEIIRDPPPGINTEF